MTATDPVIARIAQENPAQQSHSAGRTADAEAARILERILHSPAPAHTWSRRAHGIRSALAPALGIAIAVIVALVALGTARHHAPPTNPARVPGGARQLVAKLAVLRRPQTAADRLPAPVRAQLKNSDFGSAAIPRLTRLAATVNGGAERAGGESIYLLVGTPRGYHVDIATALVVTGATGHRYLVTPPEVVEERAAIQTHGLTPTAVASDYGYQLCGPTWCKGELLPGGRGATVAVVPDGVNRVKWVFGRIFRHFRLPGGAVVTIYPHVQNNVAVAKPAGVGGLSSATWYGSDGRAIASLSTQTQRAAQKAQALAASVRRPIGTELIKHLAIFRHPVPPPATIKALPRGAALLAVNGPYGLNVAQARFIPYPGSPGLWLVPGTDGLSMINQEPCERLGKRRIRLCGGFSGGNAPTRMVLSGAMIYGFFGPDRQTIWGVAPDGNPTVTAVLADGSRRIIRVIDNVYTLTVKPQSVHIIEKDAAGREVTNRAP